MSDLSVLLDRSSRAMAIHQGDLSIMPRLSTIVLSCVDARVDPSHVFGLDPGDAIVIRNAGGRVTPELQRELTVLGFLASNMPGAGEVKPELVIVHHTDCGMSRLNDPQVRGALAARLGIDVEEVDSMTITDPADAVYEDIDRLRRSALPDTLIVSGLVYDVADGSIQQVAGPFRLRDSAPTGAPEPS